MKKLHSLGISKDIMANAFQILDEDGSGSFDIDDFLSMIFKLLNPPQSQDIQVLHNKLSQMASQLNLSLRGVKPAKTKNIESEKSLPVSPLPELSENPILRSSSERSSS